MHLALPFFRRVRSILVLLLLQFLLRIIVPQSELPPRVLGPVTGPHQLVDDHPDVDEGVVVILGHAGHHVSDDVLKSIGGTLFTVVQLLQPVDGQELVHVDPVLQ